MYPNSGRSRWPDLNHVLTNTGGTSDMVAAPRTDLPPIAKTGTSKPPEGFPGVRSGRADWPRSRHRSDHCVAERGDSRRYRCVQECEAIRRLARSSAAAAFHRREDPAGRITKAGIVTLTFVRQPEVRDDFAVYITLRFGRTCTAARH